MRFEGMKKEQIRGGREGKGGEGRAVGRTNVF
jgi:hypothetical protein